MINIFHSYGKRVEQSIVHQTEEMRRLNVQNEEFQQLFIKATDLTHFKQLLALNNMKIFAVDDYGAVGDGVANDTQAIISALQACGVSGASGVPSAIFFTPTKVYNSFPFTLVSFCSLYLSSGSTLQLSNNISAWPVTNNSSYSTFISGTKLNSISIFGGGFINGQGEIWWEEFNEGNLPYERPYMFRIGVTDLILDGFTIVNAPKFNIILYESENVEARGLTILAPYTSPNTDGFDCEYSSNVHLHNSIIINGDDGVAVKQNSKNILIEEVLFGGGHGMSIGSVQN